MKSENKRLLVQEVNTENKKLPVQEVNTDDKKIKIAENHLQIVNIRGNRTTYFNNLSKKSNTTYLIPSMYENKLGLKVNKKNIKQFMLFHLKHVSEYHEIRRADKSTKFFLDIEFIDKKDNTDNCDLITDYFVNKIKEYDNSDCSKIRGRYNIIIYNASRNYKLSDGSNGYKCSFHVIMPNIIFENIAILGNFVCNIINSYDNDLKNVDISKYIDTAVYKPGLFRIPLCSKNNKKNTFLSPYYTDLDFFTKHDIENDENGNLNLLPVEYYEAMFIQYTPKVIKRYTYDKLLTIMGDSFKNYNDNKPFKKLSDKDRKKLIYNQLNVQTINIETKDTDDFINKYSKSILILDTKEKLSGLDIEKVCHCISYLDDNYANEYQLWYRVLLAAGQIYKSSYTNLNILNKKPNGTVNNEKKEFYENVCNLVLKECIKFSKKSSKFKNDQDVINLLCRYETGRITYKHILKQLKNTNKDAYNIIYEKKDADLQDLCNINTFHELLVLTEEYSKKNIYLDVNQVRDILKKVLIVTPKLLYIREIDETSNLYPYAYKPYTRKEFKDFVGSSKIQFKTIPFEDIHKIEYTWFITMNHICYNLYDAVYFDPTMADDYSGKLFNTYVPIPYNIKVPSEVDDRLRLFNKYFEEQICGKDNNNNKYIDKYNYILDWLAYVLQTRDRTGVMLLLCGEKQTGKSLFCTFVNKLVTDKYSITLNSTDEMFSQFNCYRDEKLIINIDEHKLHNKNRDQFKSIVSRNRDTSINAKYGKKSKKKMFDNYIGSCNNIESVNLEHGDRRHCIIECAKKKMNNTYGTKIYNLIMNVDFISCIYSLLMERDISKFDPNNIPHSEVRSSSLVAKLNTFDIFLMKNYHTFTSSESIRGDIIVNMYNKHLSDESRNINKDNKVKSKDLPYVARVLSSFNFERKIKKEKKKRLYYYYPPKNLKEIMVRKFNIKDIQYYINLFANSNNITDDDIKKEENERVIKLPEDKRSIIERFLNKKAIVSEKELTIQEKLELLDDESKEKMMKYLDNLLK